MRRTSFASMSCSVARSLEQIGDWWTLLVIREAFYGTRRFKDFEAHLGIAPNILSGRLSKLVEHGIFVITETTPGGKALEYRLSDKGRDLFPIIVAIAQWGDKHASGPKGPPIRIVERTTQEEIAPITLRSSRGQPLNPREVTVVEGPGATKADKKRFEEVRRQRLARAGEVAAEAEKPAATRRRAPAKAAKPAG
jgi:DNA-binding HxlR family transcriptional regulator